MNTEIILLGQSALLMHNPAMVDPENESVRKIKALTGKRKKTDADLKEIEDIEWHGGLYMEAIEGRVVITQPCSKVRKCLINAGKISKQGKQVERALAIAQLHVPLIYEGSEKIRDIEAELKRLYA